MLLIDVLLYQYIMAQQTSRRKHNALLPDRLWDVNIQDANQH